MTDDARATSGLFTPLRAAVDAVAPLLEVEEIARILSVGDGVALATGFADLRADELLALPHGVMGLAANLRRDRIGVILLGDAERVRPGDRLRRTGRVAGAPVGDALLGRVVDALGEPLDGLGRIAEDARLPIERPAPPILHRAPVTTPLHTGIKAVDAGVPIGRGQRQLIIGDRQTGKTTIAVDAILNQGDDGALAVYCAIGQRASAVAQVVQDLRRGGALGRTVVVVAGGDDAPGLQFVAPYAATTMAEHFVAQGRDVLIVYDDLTRHARAYRELSLLLRRPPGREAYPGDIFHVHARLLERSARLREERGGGSLTALPVVETQAQNISGYIPTNLISITDGQIYLSPTLFEKGRLPAIDIGASVSRVGGKAQLPAFRAVAGRLRLLLAQFEELESFARFGAQLDPDTRRRLTRGERVRAALRQNAHEPLSAAAQVATLLAATEGLFDALDPDAVADAEAVVRRAARDRASSVCAAIESGAPLDDASRRELLAVMREALGSPQDDGHGDA